MSFKAVLLDLENNMPTANLLRNIVEHFPVLYLFNSTGQFEYSLEDLTEFASWITSGQVVILDTPETSKKEFEYAVIVGQLIALLEPDSHVEIISAIDSSDLLLELMQSSNISCNLIQIQADIADLSKHELPSAMVIQAKPQLQLVKKYCDALGKMTGKPHTVEALRHSVENILQLVPEKAQQVIGLLINLKIVKRYDEQINFRKKVLAKWLKLDLNKAVLEQPKSMADALQQLECAELQHTVEVKLKAPVIQKHELYKNFEQVDPVQLEVIKKLNALNAKKPKDIYELRDVLVQIFPKSDVRLLLKELMDKGYIYWNGHEVVYSHEMFLN